MERIYPSQSPIPSPRTGPSRNSGPYATYPPTSLLNTSQQTRNIKGKAIRDNNFNDVEIVALTLGFTALCFTGLAVFGTVSGPVLAVSIPIAVGIVAGIAVGLAITASTSYSYEKEDKNPPKSTTDVQASQLSSRKTRNV